VFVAMAAMLFMQTNRYIIITATLFLAASVAASYIGFGVRRPTSRMALPSLFISNLAIASLFFIDGR